MRRSTEYVSQYFRGTNAIREFQMLQIQRNLSTELAVRATKTSVLIRLQLVL